MKNDLMKKCIQISRIIIALMVFGVLNLWFISENDPQWIISIIISIIVFLISFPSSKICIFLINKGDKIKSKIIKLLFYTFALPIVFVLLLGIVAILCVFIVEFIFPIDSINLGIAVLIAFAGIGIFTCILFPYFQTIIILILRCFFKFRNSCNK